MVNDKALSSLGPGFYDKALYLNIGTQTCSFQCSNRGFVGASLFPIKYEIGFYIWVSINFLNQVSFINIKSYR